MATTCRIAQAARCRAPRTLGMAFLVIGTVALAEMGCVKVEISGGTGLAEVNVNARDRYRLELAVDPKGAQQPLVVSVELPSTGPERWPAEDVVVLDAQGQPMAVCRDGLEWHRLWITVPPERATYVVQLWEHGDDRSLAALPAESEKTAVDARAGLTVTICRWFDNRRAALSLRFDDSHPTHLTTVLPILREYGFKGTFMVNPGTRDYLENESGWRALAQQGDMELANHTLHHRGAENDEEAEREIGEAAKHLWQLCPGKSPLRALNLGGGTKWTTRKPLRYYLDKYHLFYVSGSLGMDDVYGNRVAALREHLARHIGRGLWCRVHFHSVGEGLATTAANFRAAMEVVKEFQSELWIAGMADIYKYQEEWKRAKLSVQMVGKERARIRIAVGTDPAVYDQPLTLQLTLPPTCSAADVTVTADDKGTAVPSRWVGDAHGSVLRFEVPPVDAAYTVELAPRHGAGQ
jgi:peptidoglycan/xylan/chitin deacetylase (PgdA/CDA1 family)